MNDEQDGEGQDSIETQFATPEATNRASTQSNKTSGLRRKLFQASEKYCASPDLPKETSSFIQNSPLTPKHSQNAKDILENTPERFSSLTERQQTALLLQLTAEDTRKGVDNSPVECCDIKLKRLLRRNERGETQLHLATIRGDAQLVKQLIKKGHPVDSTDFAGWTALHEASNHGWLEIASILLKNGANVNAKGDENVTPLHDAAQAGSYKLVQLLLKHGADINIPTSKGKTALDVASTPSVNHLLKKRGKENTRPVSRNIYSGDLTPPVTPIMKRASPHRGSASPRLTLKLSVGGAPSPVSSSDESHVKKMDFNKEGKEDSKDAKSKEQPTTSTAEAEEEKDRNVVSSSKDGEATSSVNTDTSKEADAKRGHSDDEDDEESKKKKKKEDAPKAGTPARSGVNRAPNKHTGNKGTPNNAKATSSPMHTERKSPVSSPTIRGQEGDDDGEKKESFLKVPPLKIVLAPLRDRETEGETRGNTGKNGGNRHPYILQKPSQGPNSPETSTQATSSSPSSSTAESKGNPEGKNPTPDSPRAVPPDSSDVPVSSCQPSTSAPDTSTVPPSSEASSIPPTVDLHPRKRKLRPRETSPPAPNNASPSNSSSDDQPSGHSQAIANSYQSFFSLRKQIESRHRNLYPVQPKPPGGFKDYLMNRCSYVLAGNAASRLSVPRIQAPNSLQPPLKELFNEQERERYKLRLQHLIEKEKLVLAVEQEILRVHGQYARALVSQPLPLSVCTILKDQEIYNAISPEQEEKDRTARSRYNGRLFLSWLQDVDDKWDKIKEDMVLRHINESESLLAVQKMMWEWKLKEIGCCEPKATPNIPDEDVPQVHVLKDFDLLPA